ncbi:flagellar basal body P-ring protein FlgI [Klebsiella pneumoniae]|uniref:flagellar basal body P-ring protein FlgI n=1 Tax=Klebsiella pneumoniae TaxID=573 RepID=UPI003D349733
MADRPWQRHKRRSTYAKSGGSLQSVRSSASLNNVVRALNALGATPMDLMSILQSMQSAGCLRAKLEII